MVLENNSNLIRKISPLIVGTFVAFSGFCSLVYQVTWERTLKYNFGGDSISSAIVTATFLLGLGIGAFIFGKWRKNAFNIYALVEMSIGTYAIISYYLLAPLAIILGQLFSYSISDTDGLRYIVVVACVLFLLPPCILMGGTLPLMFNCFIRPSSYQNKTVGMIYGLNTAGAAIGILAVPFLFLNHISIPSTLLIVGTGNIFLGIGVWLYGRTFASGEMNDISEAQETVRETDNRLSLPPLLLLSFSSGFITLSFEISLFRTIGLITKMSPYTFPLVLMPFLLALALGSILFTRFKEYSITRALNRIGMLFTLAAFGMLVGVLLRYLLDFDSFSVRDLFFQGHLIFPLLLLIVPVPFLQGGVFPLLLRLASSQGKELPSRTGKIYLSNSVGSFLGAMLAQFYGFPQLGTKGLIISLFLIGMMTGVLCLVWTVDRVKKVPPVAPSFQPKYLVTSTALALVFVPLLIPTAMWDIYTFGDTGPNIDAVEGVSGIATITWKQDHSKGRVSVNGQLMSIIPDHPKHTGMISIAQSMPNRENVLVLGLGGGTMIRELVNDAAVKRIDVVDWSHELPQVLESPASQKILENALHHPKVRLYGADARVAASLYDDHLFDVVIDNLAIFGWVGSTSIKSVTYFREISRILKPTGAFVFAPNYPDPPPSFARESVLVALLENFQYVQEHYEFEKIIIASSLPVEIDHQQAEAVLANHREILDLSEPYADWILEGFKPISASNLPDNTPPIVDELLIYEYTLFGNLDTPPDPTIYDQYVGQYQFSPTFSITVSKEGDHLMAQATNQNKVEIFPESRTKFFLKAEDAQIEFVRGQSGQITSLVLYYENQKLSGSKIK